MSVTAPVVNSLEANASATLTAAVAVAPTPLVFAQALELPPKTARQAVDSTVAAHLHPPCKRRLHPHLPQPLPQQLLRPMAAPLSTLPVPPTSATDKDSSSSAVSVSVLPTAPAVAALAHLAFALVLELQLKTARLAVDSPALHLDPHFRRRPHQHQHQLPPRTLPVAHLSILQVPLMSETEKDNSSLVVSASALLTAPVVAALAPPVSALALEPRPRMARLVVDSMPSGS